MTKIISFLKFIFHTSVLLLIVISLFPGSLIGLLLYGELSVQPNLIQNPFGTTLNHFIYYFYVALFGFCIYSRNESFQKLVYGLFFLSIVLEIMHFMIPNRTFELYDLIANFLGVGVAYLLITIYLFFKKS